MKYLYLSLLLFSSTCLLAQGFDQGKLDQYLNSLETHDKAMMSVAILKDGQTVYEKSIGYASTEEQQKPDSETQYRIGSITKVFTSVMLLQLVEEGKLSLETKLSKFYPDVVNAEFITITHLLRHQSGIHNFTNDASFLATMTDHRSKADMIRLIEGLKSNFEPGTSYEYSNSGFVLLGFIIEDITGDSYANQLKKRVTEPLELKRTAYGGPIQLEQNQAKSYQFRFGGWASATVTDMSIPHGAGAIISTPGEVAKFLTALFEGKLISQSSLDQMKEIDKGYGLGLMRMPFYNFTGYGHNGGIDGFVSNSAYFKSEGLAIAVCANGLNMVMNDALLAILSIYFGRPFDLPDFEATPVELNTKLLPKYEGTFASAGLPLKITIKVSNGQLTAQATGQPAFPLTAYSATEFRYDLAGIVLKFGEDGKKVDYSTFQLKQGGGNFQFVRE